MKYRIQEFRESLMMTQETLAKESGVSCDIIQALENGTIQIVSSEILIKLAKALCTTVDRISTQASPPNKDLLLNNIGYKKLLEIISPEEIQEAKYLLGTFLQGMGGVDVETIAVFSYLFGVKQHYQNLYGVDKQGRTFADTAEYLVNVGKQLGFYEALLLFGKVPQYSIVKKPQAPVSAENKAEPSTMKKP